MPVPGPGGRGPVGVVAEGEVETGPRAEQSLEMGEWNSFLWGKMPPGGACRSWRSSPGGGVGDKQRQITLLVRNRAPSPGRMGRSLRSLLAVWPSFYT